MAQPNTSESVNGIPLQEALAEARASERRIRGLLAEIAALLCCTDAEVVLNGIAESAVRHLLIPRVTVHEVDHQLSVIRCAAVAELEGQPDQLWAGGRVRVRLLETPPQSVPLAPGEPLADFALGEEVQRLASNRGARPGDWSRLLTQMRCGVGADGNAPGPVVGILVAEGPDPVVVEQSSVVHALATLGATAMETARMERLRSQLISAVSHELRTPLAAIRAYNELLLDGDAGPINDEQRLLLERIDLLCQQLDRMVEDMLDLSRLRAGDVVVPTCPVDVRAVIEHIIDTLSPEAAQRQVVIREEVAAELPQISSNPDRLAQVLFNLVGNAVKYVGAGGKVVVRAFVGSTGDYLESATGEEMPESGPQDERCVVIEVVDNGPGIAPEDIDRIFDEFYRGKLTEGSSKGSGLGLAIARRLTGLLRGKLSVESTPGEGSVFRLVFPIPQRDTCGDVQEEVSRCAG